MLYIIHIFIYFPFFFFFFNHFSRLYLYLTRSYTYINSLSATSSLSHIFYTLALPLFTFYLTPARHYFEPTAPLYNIISCACVLRPAYFSILFYPWLCFSFFSHLRLWQLGRFTSLPGYTRVFPGLCAAILCTHSEFHSFHFVDSIFFFFFPTSLNHHFISYLYIKKYNILCLSISQWIYRRCMYTITFIYIRKIFAWIFWCASVSGE